MMWDKLYVALLSSLLTAPLFECYYEGVSLNNMELVFYVLGWCVLIFYIGFKR